MLRRSRTFVVATIVVLISLSLLTVVGNAPSQQVSAAPGQGTPAPTVAPINAQGQGPTKYGGWDTRIPLPVYDKMAGELDGTLQSFGYKTPVATTLFDLSDANYFINPDTHKLSSLTVSLCNSGAADITKIDSKTPDGFPAKVIGAVFAPNLPGNPTNNAMVLAYVPDKSPHLRFYVNSSLITVDGLTGYTEHQFVGQSTYSPAPASCNNGNSPVAQPGRKYPVQPDEGTIVSATETCFTVGLTQECYQYSPRSPNASKALQNAYNVFISGATTDIINDLKDIHFDFDRAVTDIKGDAQRSNCAKISGGAKWSDGTVPDQCMPSVVFAGVTGYLRTTDVPSLNGTHFAKGEVIGFIAVLSSQDIMFDSILHGDKNKNFPNGEIDRIDATSDAVVQGTILPKGSYVWVDTDPNIPAGGMSKLVEVDPKGNGYEHPDYHLEAFGLMDVAGPKATLPGLNPQIPAFIKDGGASGAGCP